MTENNMSIHDATKAGFDLAASMSSKHLQSISDELENFTLAVKEHDEVFLPPDLAEENIADLISECKDMILKVLTLNALHKQEIEYHREAIEDDGAFSQYLKPHLEEIG